MTATVTRPMLSGRTDTLGRPIRVAAHATRSQATAPPPPAIPSNDPADWFNLSDTTTDHDVADAYQLLRYLEMNEGLEESFDDAEWMRSHRVEQGDSHQLVTAQDWLHADRVAELVADPLAISTIHDADLAYDLDEDDEESAGEAVDPDGLAIVYLLDGRRLVRDGHHRIVADMIRDGRARWRLIDIAALAASGDVVLPDDDTIWWDE